MIEPVDPLEGREFNRFAAAPRSPPMNDLGLVETVDCLGEGVVLAVAHTADRRLDPASDKRSEYFIDTY